MCAEGAIGLWQGLVSGSMALTGWALGSAVEGLASVIGICRFTGTRTRSEAAERTAQRGVAVSFWLLDPYVAAESTRDLAVGHHAATTVIGILLTAVALVMMPLLGRAKHRIGLRLARRPPPGRARRTTCGRPRQLPCWQGWSSPPGPAAGGPTPSSAWPSPP
jgi:multisubunit Na+/H+ antiporter MnhG subunit